MTLHGINLDSPGIVAFCRKWRIRELSVFGSILREDFRSDSDVDVLVTFDDSEECGLLETVEMEQELADLLGRRVDLAEKDQLKWVIRDRVVDSARVIYAA